MKLKEITVKKEALKKLTIKGRNGGFKSDESTGGVTMTFTMEEGEHLRDEVEVAQEANESVRKALKDLMDEDEQDWLRQGRSAYKEAKGYDNKNT